MKCSRVFCLFVLFTLGPLASASDQNGLFAIRGAGLLTCHTYVQEREAASDAYVMIGGWLDGYVTAVNELSEQTFDVAPYLSTELLTVLINRHCQENSTDILFAVTNTLLAKLYDERLKSSSAYVDVRVGVDQMRLYTDTIARIQTSLAAKGLLDVEATGQWNLATENALARYQESIGMNGTGFPDQATLWNLLRSA
ncbi:MAG: peptidoglycan-binding domain-containing protein [Gammaproteobacteria bacterium]|nr:peptidoglycan-binding domain-containing protein [Gammaproteobacteria bacterium]